MLKLIVAVLIVIVSLTGCVTDDQGSKTWSVPQRVDLHTRLGFAYLQQGRLAAAQEELEFALVLGPDNSSAHHAMALLKLKLGHPVLAREHYERAIVVDPGNYLVRNDFGSHLCALGLHLEGIDQLTAAVNDPFNSSRHISHYRIGVCMNLSGRLEKAYAHLTKALRAQPSSGPVLYEAADVSFRLGRHLPARGFLERYFEQGKPTPASLLLAVKNERELGSKPLVQHYAYQLRMSYPDSPEAAEVKELISGAQGG